MFLTNKQTKQFAVFYLICFLIYYTWFFYCGRLFCSLKPVYFINRLDLSLNIILSLNIQKLIFKYRLVQVLFDLMYVLLPIFLTYSFIKEKKIHKVFAIITAFFSFLYCLLYSAMSVISVEVFIAWMLVPLLFYTSSVKGFYFSMHCLRIFFIIIFFSAALWKLFTGSIFNSAQMSGVLLTQHANYLASNNNDFFRNSILYLIRHKSISYSLYLAAFCIEFIFVFAFFTKRLDKFLITLFCMFLIFDYFLMGINYFFWLPFMGCFYYSKYEL